MKIGNPFSKLSIFGRTFLLMLTALTISEGIGITLILTRPPIHNHPVALDDIAQRLQLSGAPVHDQHLGPPSELAGKPPMELAGGPPDGPPKGPPDNFDQGPRPAKKVSSPDDKELRIYQSPTPPSQPENLDPVASNVAKERLLAKLHINPEDLRVYLRHNKDFSDRPQYMVETSLPEGFVVARKLPDDSWKILESTSPVFMSMFHIEGLILFAVGLVILLPITWLFSLSLARPIAKFSQAAKRLGADPNAPPLAVEGPSEMLLAIESFNSMQERLNSLLRERTDMIAAIAHDLRTPLTRLAFRLDDLPSPLNEKVSADIQEMKSMISLALDFIRDRSQTLQRERLDFRLLVESVVDDQCDIGQDVILEKGPSITLEGDPLALRRAVMNVVDNAIKYGTRARLQLNTTAEYCILEIEDDGPGINEALHKRVFEPFFRVENSRNRDTGGVGLGLALVRAIIQEHGGDISLRNKKPKGLQVTIQLPLLY